MDDRELTEFLSGVVGVVEANSYERSCLWQRHHKERGLPWVENNFGMSWLVGSLNDAPVAITLWTAMVAGHKLLFVDPSSQVVDHRMIDKWLSDNMPRSAMTDRAPVCVNKVDAQNFNNVFPRE